MCSSDLHFVAYVLRHVGFIKTTGFYNDLHCISLKVRLWIKAIKSSETNCPINMIITKRTNSADKNFQEFVRALDIDLKIRDGEEHSFYARFNKIDMIKHVVVAYDGDEPVGCGAVKEFSADTMELKRMYVPLNRRGQGIASIILMELG